MASTASPRIVSHLCTSPQSPLAFSNNLRAWSTLQSAFSPPPCAVGRDAMRGASHFSSNPPNNEEDPSDVGHVAAPLSNSTSAAIAEETANLLTENTSFFEGGAGMGCSYKEAVRKDALERNGMPSFASSLAATASGGAFAQSLCASVVDFKWAEECRDAQPFGVYLGTALDLVPAYSNGAVEDISHGVSFLPGTRIYCGMPWECLEYARRFLISWYGITFASMDGANSLFNCDYFMYIENYQKSYPCKAPGEEDDDDDDDDSDEKEIDKSQWTAPAVSVKREVNGEATQVPAIGSLLLYPIVYPAADMPFGHVSVVVERSAHHIRVAEQNWDNSKWAHLRYSRQLEVSIDANTGKVTVLDEEPYAVLGWLDFSENERRPPAFWDKSYANDLSRFGPSTVNLQQLGEGAGQEAGAASGESVSNSTHEDT